MTFNKGELVQPDEHNVQVISFDTGTAMVKGNWYTMAAGELIVLAAAATTALGAYVALEDKTFAAGTSDTCQVATAGSYVTVEVEGTIQPGAMVKVDDVGGTKVDVASAANLAAGLVVGRYIKHAGEAEATPAADGETNCVVLLGGAA